MLGTYSSCFRPRPFLWVGSLFFLVLSTGTAFSSPPPTSDLWPWVWSWSPTAFLSGINSRTRVVQVCVVVMCLALFILMKKFSEPPISSGPSKSPRLRPSLSPTSRNQESSD